MADKLTLDTLNQQLSALADDECAPAETELLIRRLCSQPELRERWRRYHLLSDVLGGQLPARIDTGFAARVSAAIASEPALPAPAAGGRWRPALAAAAAVSAAALGLSLLLSQQTPSTAPQLTAVDVADTSGTAGTAIATTLPADTVPPEAADQTRLDDYLASHSEYAAVNGVHGLLPLVHRVSYNVAGR